MNIIDILIDELPVYTTGGQDVTNYVIECINWSFRHGYVPILGAIRDYERLKGCEAYLYDAGRYYEIKFKVIS